MNTPEHTGDAPQADHDTREQLADYAHAAWAGWMTYLFTKSVRNDDGSATIPKELVERWNRQVSTSYADLPESEKQSDRAEADKMLALIEPLLRAARADERAQVEKELAAGGRWAESAQRLWREREDARFELAAMRARLAQWVSVDERLPADWQDVAVCFVNRAQEPQVLTGHYRGLCGWRVWGRNDGDEITHWMPLPAPPATPTTQNLNTLEESPAAKIGCATLTGKEQENG